MKQRKYSISLDPLYFAPIKSPKTFPLLSSSQYLSASSIDKL